MGRRPSEEPPHNPNNSNWEESPQVDDLEGGVTGGAQTTLTTRKRTAKGRRGKRKEKEGKPTQRKKNTVVEYTDDEDSSDNGSARNGNSGFAYNTRQSPTVLSTLLLVALVVFSGALLYGTVKGAPCINKIAANRSLHDESVLGLSRDHLLHRKRSQRTFFIHFDAGCNHSIGNGQSYQGGPGLCKGLSR